MLDIFYSIHDDVWKYCKMYYRNGCEKITTCTSLSLKIWKHHNDKDANSTTSWMYPKIKGTVTTIFDQLFNSTNSYSYGVSTFSGIIFCKLNIDNSNSPRYSINHVLQKVLRT